MPEKTVSGGWAFGDPGILVIDKPRGPSSHQVTAWVGEMLAPPMSGTAGPLIPWSRECWW